MHTYRLFDCDGDLGLIEHGDTVAGTIAKRLRCYLGFHRWQRLKGEDDSGWYKQCRDCGKCSDIPPTPWVG